MKHIEDQILELIGDYIACSTCMCNALRNNYSINEETILRARRIKLIPKEGVLHEGYSFSFHGGGCYFEFSEGSIDVEFGPEDRCDGFDSFRLYEFLEASDKEYGYLVSEKLINESLEKLLKKGILIQPGWVPGSHLYYLNNK